MSGCRDSLHSVIPAHAGMQVRCGGREFDAGDGQRPSPVWRCGWV